MSSEYEFVVNHSPEKISSVTESIENDINKAGSFKNFLNEIEYNQAQTSNGRAELYRLWRTARLISNPATNAETAQTRAFYEGALFSSAIIAKLSGQPDFINGSLVHDTYRQRLSEAHEVHGTEAASIQDKIFVYQQVAQDIIDDVYTWPLEELCQPDLQVYAECHLEENYEQSHENDDPFTMASVGFWMPLREIYDPAVMEGFHDLIYKVSSDLPDKFYEDLYYNRAKHEIDSTINDLEYEPILTERSLLLQYFNKLEAGFASMSTHIPDETALLALLRHNESQLNTLNREHSLIATGELLEISGTYFCEIKEGDDSPRQIEMPQAIKVVGTFKGVAIINAPIIADKPHPESPENQTEETVELRRTPALVINNPTFITQAPEGKLGETIAEQTEDTTLTIPVIYASADISRII